MDNSRGFFWAYLIILFVAVIGGIYAFNYRVGSLAPTLFGMDTNPTDFDPTKQRLQELADMKLKDSDSDGIDDFNETYVYHTSAYLADSDSDGATDKQELDKGEDPNCVQGKVCTHAVNTNSVTTTNAVASTGNTPINATANTLLSGNINATDLRQQLAEVGVDASALAAVSDEELMSTYASVLQDNPGLSGAASAVSSVNSTSSTTTTTTTTNTNPYADLLNVTNGNTSSGLGNQSISQLQNLNANQIRDLLRQNGVTADQLSSLDDTTLQSLYQQTLADQLKTLNSNQ